jgi:general stress protein 26
MDDLRARALELLATAPVALVTTLDAEGRPNTRAMFNLRNRAQFPAIAARFDGGFTTVLTTNTASPKMAEIARNPAATLYYCRPEDWHGLMLGGDLEVVRDPEMRQKVWMPEWTRYYPGGWNDPDHTVLLLRPTRIKVYDRLRHAEFTE